MSLNTLDTEPRDCLSSSSFTPSSSSSSSASSPLNDPHFPRKKTKKNSLLPLEEAYNNTSQQVFHSSLTRSSTHPCCYATDRFSSPSHHLTDRTAMPDDVEKRVEFPAFTRPIFRGGHRVPCRQLREHARHCTRCTRLPPSKYTLDSARRGRPKWDPS